MTRFARPIAVLCAFSALAAFADTGSDVYRALGIDPGKVLSGTVLQAPVLPGGEKQVVSIVTYFTGKRDEARAINVRLDVFRRSGGKLVPVYSRDLGDERGGNVGRGEIQLVDLDGDATNEIVVSWDDASDPLVQRRTGEVLVCDGERFRTAWAGDLRYDATRAARKVPENRRDRWAREIDIPATLRTRGITLFMTKTVFAVAGERLPEPQTVRETFPLRGASEP